MIGNLATHCCARVILAAPTIAFFLCVESWRQNKRRPPLVGWDWGWSWLFLSRSRSTGFSHTTRTNNDANQRTGFGLIKVFRKLSVWSAKISSRLENSQTIFPVAIARLRVGRLRPTSIILKCGCFAVGNSIILSGFVISYPPIDAKCSRTPLLPSCRKCAERLKFIRLKIFSCNRCSFISIKYIIW